ncbi:MAG: magnesium transporter [Burkholderiaceae bacterium]|nr:magnesium transporter [Sulfuritalea sp.]MCF8175695.1 magnesium transporter [Burkholderiaceae bacterium]
MSTANPTAVAALNRRYLQDYPFEAAALLEGMSAEDGADLLALQPPHVVVRAWQALGPDVARAIVERVPDEMALYLLSEAEPAISVAILAQWDGEERERRLTMLDAQVAHELREQLAYPENSAGRLMDHKLSPLRVGLSVGQALTRLRSFKQHGLRELFVVDDAGSLIGRVEIQDLAVADPARPLREILRPLLAAVSALDPREDVAAILERQPITELPVVNVEGRFVGIIRHAALQAAIEEESTIDIQTMVGASRDERALSSSWFAVKKRLPWLQINLLTAFLAAAVVGMFEGTIAKVTALAVLLPVVAGQSGNAGAQALAVTMRGLVLREISLRHWPRVVGKEAGTGLINGLAVAATTAVGVYAWSGSVGLVMVITSSMVIAMVIAGIAGALVPIVLSRFGMDPAQSSSIVLTTVTDVAGFFSFLGIATLLADRLV